MARILVVGATGHLGGELVKACLQQGHEAHALVRPATRTDPEKMQLLQAAGATLHEGDLKDHDSLIRACRSADIVISAVGGMQVGDEGALVKAVKEAGVQRFVPSDFGLDPAAAGPGSCVLFDAKAAVHKMVKAAGIPYTFVHSNAFFSYWANSLGDLTRLGGKVPPDEVSVYGDGNVMGALTSVPDVAKATVRAVNDPRVRNKEIRITANTITQNLLIALWQTTSGRTVKRTSVPAAELEKIIAASTAPDQGATLVVSQLHRSLWIRGDSVKRVPTSLEATELYPDMAFQTIEQGLTQLV
ncbi:MAG TPA: aromatic alcohol reductase [Vicinamibacteria bacterium]|nr:aromatic alcohol reductase [Vicinamibacteria bacterium]